MISAVSFIPMGTARANPIENELAPEELEELIKQSELMTLEEEEDGSREDGDSDGDAENEGDMDMNDKEKEEEFMKSMKMDDYDDEQEGPQNFLAGETNAAFQSNREDPHYVVEPGQDPDTVREEEENDDLAIRPNDNIVLVGRTEKEHSFLEVYVFEEETSSFYVHHDISLPSFPLAMSWMNCDPRGSSDMGNFVAIGTFQPGIEIWNLDVLDALEPVASLGGRKDPPKGKIKLPKGKKGKKGKKKLKGKKLKNLLLGEFKEGSHEEAVMCLDWHHAQRQRLVSGSADCTVKLWDVTTQVCTSTLTHHTNKVQALKWHPLEPSVLLSGSFDGSVAVTDVRNPKSAVKFAVDADIESVAWNPHNPNYFVASTEKGTVTCYDVRKPKGKPLFTLAAHNGATSCVSFNVVVPNLLATSSPDKSVKIWDVSDGKPKMVCSRDLKIGPLFTMTWDTYNQFNDSPFLLAAGGGQGKVAIWDTLENDHMTKLYGHLVRKRPEAGSSSLSKN